ncbi:glycoside hydrolase family 127 protein [Caldalkalibacillus salinus]|uniref:glycoside hydrolase family 127 protein n=1 Tax=Caldalkalibacillus salinus TaxID=2803787 RepID=UPI001F417207|nr:beta-L-arabinofuranosidase domain-containing protein [Caldalkalibacillus salinus]
MKHTQTGLMRPVNLKYVKVTDAFWSPWQALVKDTIISYQWDALNDRIPGAAPSHTIDNFEIAAGKKEGQHYGMVFQDSDLYKWMETVSYVLAANRDEKWEKVMDEVIELLEQAQEEDGYLNTYFTVSHPEEKWTNLKDDHELYCAGHLIEAAVAYYEATGKEKIIRIVGQLVDHIMTVLGPEPGKKRGYPGHPEIELALIKLYRVTKEEKYLQLCQFFIDERGKQSPHYYDVEIEQRGDDQVQRGVHNYDYFQAHLPMREQTTAEGHSVRAVYLYSGIVDLAVELSDDELLQVSRTLWENTVNKRMYITGGIGSSAYQERFTVDYDLPNDRAYTETCAAIALIFWAQRMIQVDGHARYADIMERALYNGALSGISLDGKRYFYVNPLEVWPHTANHRHDMHTVKTTRQPWFGCACCPPNIARLLASLGEYIYSANDTEAYVHLFIGSETQFDFNNQTVCLKQRTDYPWEGKANFTVSAAQPVDFTLNIRQPEWCQQATVQLNGQTLSYTTNKGYIKLQRTWHPGDQLTLEMEMPINIVHAHPEVRENAGKVALQRGPIVYCLEEADNGRNLHDIHLAQDASVQSTFEPSLLNGVTVLTGKAYRTDSTHVPDQLYTTQVYPKIPFEFKAIPYYTWANRGEGEMLVWLRSDQTTS